MVVNKFFDTRGWRHCNPGGLHAWTFVKGVISTVVENPKALRSKIF